MIIAVITVPFLCEQTARGLRLTAIELKHGPLGKGHHEEEADMLFPSFNFSSIHNLAICPDSVVSCHCS